jgi:hypothetical protein
MTVNLLPYALAAYPAIALASLDEDRAVSQILTEFAGRAVSIIAATGGLRSVRFPTAEELEQNNNLLATRLVYEPIDPMAQYVQAFSKASESEDAILIVLDWQHIARNAGAYRGLRQRFSALKMAGSMIILVAPSWNLPPEISTDIPVIDLPLPNREELSAALDICAQGSGVNPNGERDALLDASSGLTMGQAENAFALTYAKSARFDPADVLVEKMRVVKQSGYLEWIQPADPGTLGGLGAFRQYVSEEVLPVRDSMLLRVRGILAVGVAGGGKSLSARVIGALLGWPVIRGNVSGMKGKYVGDSEGNMLAALKLAEAVSPCVFFLDEVEKGVAGHSSDGDPVTSGMVGILLTWLQDHTSPILTFATCNNYAKLPAELTRAGRFDERFFVDLPTDAERPEIALIHLNRLGCDPGLADHVSSITVDWTGAEIAQLVLSASRRTDCRPTAGDLTAASLNIKPISKVRGDEVKALRDWGRANLRIANTPTTEAVRAGRKVRAQSPETR